jgi:hypothetical protein
LATSTGMAKEMPAAAFIELMPMTSPSKLTSGPPLLPNCVHEKVAHRFPGNAS